MSDIDLPLSQQSDAEISSRVRSDLEKWENRFREWRTNAKAEYDAVAGRQWSADDEAKLKEEERPTITFNRLGVLVDAVCGSQVNNRQEMRYLPRSMNDQGMSDVLQGIVTWARDGADAEDAESDAFRDLAVCGMGWTNNRPDYDEDPEGRIVKDRISPLMMRWDPAAKKKNLADARWKAQVQRIPNDEAQSLWPQFSGSGLGTNGNAGVASRRSQRDEYQTDSDAETYDDDTVEVVEYQWKETEPVFMVADEQSGQVVRYDAERWAKILETLPEKGRPRAVRIARSKWYRVIVCGDEVLQPVEPCPDQEDSTYQCMTGRRDERTGEWYGIIRALMDPQMWANKWLAQSLHILNTSAKSGLLAEEGAIPDFREFEKDYARTGSISIVSPGALTGARLREKIAPTMPAGFYQLLQFAVSSIPDLSGINREILGTADRDQAGVLEAQRKQAAQAVLAPLFDALRLYYKRDGRQMARMVKAYVSQQRQVRIMGEDGNPQIIAMANMPDVAQYDIVVDEAPTSPNQKMEVWQFMAPMLPAILKQGIASPIMAELLKFSPLPENVVQKIGQLLQAQDQQSQGPDPETMKVQAQLQADAQRLQMEQAAKQQELAMERERFGIEQQRDEWRFAQEARMSQLKFDHEQRKLQLQAQGQAQKLAMQHENRKEEAA